MLTPAKYDLLVPFVSTWPCAKLMLTHALVRTLTRRGRHYRDRRVKLRWGNNDISVTQLGSAGLEPWMPAYAVRLIFQCATSPSLSVHFAPLKPL